MELDRTTQSTNQHSIHQQMSYRNEFLSQLNIRSANLQHKPYGKMKVLLETDRILITLGPDYVCFLSAFVCFLAAGYFLSSLVNQVFEKRWVKVMNLVIVVTQQFAYLLVGFSNPGVVLSEGFGEESAQGESTKRYCLKCKVTKTKDIEHCKICDVCIRGFDHHCPWVSKCIGARNLKRFYFFVSFTPLYIIYFIGMLMVSLSLSGEK